MASQFDNSSVSADAHNIQLSGRIWGHHVCWAAEVARHDLKFHIFSQIIYNRRQQTQICFVLLNKWPTKNLMLYFFICSFCSLFCWQKKSQARRPLKELMKTNSRAIGMRESLERRRESNACARCVVYDLMQNSISQHLSCVLTAALMIQIARRGTQLISRALAERVN